MEATEMAAQALENAADNLLVNGWKRGSLGERGSEMCAVGHLNVGMEDAMGQTDRYAVYTDPTLYAGWCEMTRTLYRALYWAIGLNGTKMFTGLNGRTYPVLDIPSWNDEIAKDEWEVRDAFLTAAKGLRNGEGV